MTKEIVVTVQRPRYILRDPVSLDDIRQAIEDLGGDILTIHTLSEEYEVRFRLWARSIEVEEDEEE